MTIEEKIKELKRRVEPAGPIIDSMTFSSIEEALARPRRYVSKEKLDRSAAAIRKSVIRYSRALERQS